MIHAHARARWTGRTLRVEVEGWVDPELPAKDADALGRAVADQIRISSPRQAVSPGPRGQRPPDHQHAAEGADPISMQLSPEVMSNSIIACAYSLITLVELLH